MENGYIRLMPSLRQGCMLYMYMLKGSQCCGMGKVIISLRWKCCKDRNAIEALV